MGSEMPHLAGSTAQQHAMIKDGGEGALTNCTLMGSGLCELSKIPGRPCATGKFEHRRAF